MILNTAPFCDKNEKNWSHEITFTVPLIYRCHNCNCNSTYNDLLPYIKIDVTEIEFAFDDPSSDTCLLGTFVKRTYHANKYNLKLRLQFL